jgi:hypothetical protein
MIEASHAIRIARPSLDLAAAERFYVQGLGLSAAIGRRGSERSRGRRHPVGRGQVAG